MDTEEKKGKKREKEERYSHSQTTQWLEKGVGEWYTGTYVLLTPSLGGDGNRVTVYTTCTSELDHVVDAGIRLKALGLA